jgi:D-methionine transport system ATP-binding protein
VTQSLVSGLFIKDLPAFMLQQMSTLPIDKGHAVIRLVFAGNSAGEPVISSFVKNYGVMANIVAGHMDHLREKAFGSLIITIPHSPEQFSEHLAHFVRPDLSVEVLGYIAC